ncbi:MAG: MFS transporter [Chloroflexi bacterium]|nr:MFS transporter [Chloroflexota bacterium]
MPSPWRNPVCLRLWAGQTASEAGTLVGRFALPLVAVLTLNASPVEMGLLRTADILPAIVLSLFAGVWVDRLRRRPILIGVDLGRALLLATIPLAALLGTLRIEWLYAVGVGVGVLTIVFEVAYRSYLPSLVSRDALVEANARLSATSAVVEVGSFSLAGALVQALTAPVAILVDAASFLASCASLVLIRHREAAPHPEGASHRVWAEMGEGLGVVVRHPILRPLAVAQGIRQLFTQMWVALLYLFLTRDLKLEPVLFGMLFAIGGASSFVGALAVERLVERFGFGRTFAVAFGVSSASLLLVPLASGPPLLAAAMVGSQQVFDAAGTIAEIGERTLLQSLTPGRLLGRVTAGLQLVSWTALLVGSLVGGLLGEMIGVRQTMLVAAVGALPSVWWLIASPIGALRRITPSSTSERPARQGLD